jgi:hypothetical protein
MAILLTLLGGFASAPLAADLVTLSVDGQRVENGKTLRMEFREVERSLDASLVEVKFISGGSVSSSMFILRGQCAVARARGKQFFRAEEVPGRPFTYRVTFPTDLETVDAQRRLSGYGVFSLEECRQLGF